MSEKLTPAARRQRTQIAAAVRRGDTEAAEQARREFKAIKAEDYIRTLVDSAPPLDDTTRARLAVLLRGAS